MIYKLPLGLILVCLSFLGTVPCINVKADESLRFCIYNVPYIRQAHPYWCGPASLAMIINYWGLNMTQEEVASKVYDSEANLTYTSEMTTFSKELGFESEETVGSINLLKEWIRKGCPLVVLQKLSITDDYGHYRVIVGYDDEDGTVITNDPIYGDNYNLSYSDFMELWKPGKTFSTVDWTLLTTPQNKVLADLMEKNQLSLNQIPQFSYEELKGVIDILVSKVNLLSIVSAFSAIYAAAITIVYFRHKQRKFSPLLHKPKEFTARRDMARFLGLCCYFPFFHFSSD